MKAIFANSGSDFWLDVAAQLQRCHGWKILYLLGMDSARQRANILFPDAIFHANSEAKACRQPLGRPDVSAGILDADVLAWLSRYEHLLLKMLDRLNRDGSFGWHRRVFYYHSQVSFWLGLLQEIRPDIVVFRTAPHQPFDFALYAVARYLGVHTVMFERTALPGVVLPVFSYEDGAEDIIRAHWPSQECGRPVLSEEVEVYLERLRGGYTSAMPPHLQYKLRRYKGGEIPSWPVTMIGTFQRMLLAMLRRGKGKAQVRKEWFKGLGVLCKRRLRDYYNDLAKQPDLDAPFIFAALQCEPERQAVPAGGWFSDQYLMVEMLSRSVPSDWWVYVKEHVSQYKSYQHGDLSRTREFYDRLAALPNVTLVPLTINSFELIDCARASATISGSVAWESVVRGRPAFLFGHAWYRGCEGVFNAHTHKALLDGIRCIQDGYRVDGEMVRTFLVAVEQAGIAGYIDEVYLDMNIRNEAEYRRNVDVFVSALSGLNGSGRGKERTA